MTFIRSSDDVSSLIREMKYWGDDPDLQRIADALPIEALERAYVKKLDALAPEPPSNARLPGRAVTAREKLSVMRALYAAWLKSSTERFGQMLSNAIFHDRSALEIFHIEDRGLVTIVERHHPPTADPVARAGSPSPR